MRVDYYIKIRRPCHEERLKEEQRRQAAELEKIAAAEAEAQRRVRELEELQSITGDNYKNIEEEIEAKGKKIKKLYQAYQRCQADIKDLDLEFNREREDLLDTIRTLTQQIKLKNLVLDSYVPPDEIQKLTQHMVYDEREEIWRVHRAQYAGRGLKAKRHLLAHARVIVGRILVFFSFFIFRETFFFPFSAAA